MYCHNVYIDIQSRFLTGKYTVTSTTRHLLAHHDKGSKKSFQFYGLHIWNTLAFKVEKHCQGATWNMLVNYTNLFLSYSNYYYDMSLKWTVSQEYWIIFSHDYDTISIYIISHAFSNLITTQEVCIVWFYVLLLVSRLITSRVDNHIHITHQPHKSF